MVQEFLAYVGNIRRFTRSDWIRWLVVLAAMSALTLTLAGLIALGRARGASFPAYVYLIPVGSAIFTCSLSVDNIGHFTIYRDAIAGAEAMVHQLMTVLGISGIVMMSLAYVDPDGLIVPAVVIASVTFAYTAVDEVLHWRRYVQGACDRVETWCHVFNLLGHGLMVACWLWWIGSGYEGLADALASQACLVSAS